ncbi:MAG: tail fiber domain-containing protein [Bacteroidota bacterium]
MKKNITGMLAAALLTGSLTLNAQTPWDFFGDLVPFGGATMGSNNNRPIGFETFGINRMVISNTFATVPGGVAVGSGLPLGFNTQSQFQIHNLGGGLTSMRLTNAVTGNTATSGLIMGINAAGTIGRLGWQTGSSLRLITSSVDRVTILANGFTGVNTTAPANWLEVNSGLACNSGLTFTQLNSGCAPVANPGLGVLAVDNLGNVIYVSSSNLFGDDCSVPFPGSNPLLNSRYVNMNNQNIYFADIASNLGSLYIGTNNNCGPVTSRLDIINDSKIISAFFQTTLGTGAGIAGMRAVSNNTAATGASVGVSGVSSTLGGTTIGVQGISQGGNAGFATFSIGVAGQSFNPTGASTQVIGVNGVSRNGSNYSIAGNFDVVGSSSPQNFGLQVEVMSNTFGAGGTNFGGQFILQGNNAASTEYGIYVSVPNAMNGTGTGPDYAGFFIGDVVSNTFIGLSDQRLKKDIVQIDNSLQLIMSLKPVTYKFDTETHNNLGLPANQQYGFISQQVKEVLPDLTAPVVYPAVYDSLGKEVSPKQEYLGLNYDGFIAILTKGMQDQQKMIESQQKQIDDLKNLISGQSTGGNGSATNVQLSDKNAVVLNQNTPNPFADQTVISYNIPDNTGYAQIIFYNSMGQVIKVVDIAQKGAGQLNVFAEDLSSGTYTYTLVVDGKVMDTKKMTKAR